MPIGRIFSILEDGYGLLIHGIIDLNHQNGKAAANLISKNLNTGLSVGFYVLSAKINSLGKRLILNTNLIEVSIVTNPANRLARIKEIRQFA